MKSITLPYSRKSRIYSYVKTWANKLNFNGTPNYFLLPTDYIARLALTGKGHDQEVIETIKLLSDRLTDVYLDIGANIGMMALACGSKVKRIECIEPNPIIANVLRSNLMLHNLNFRVHEFALGDETQNLQLCVPRGNMGGAFIESGNKYDTDTLAKKDGFGSFSSSNYSRIAIQCRQATKALAELAQDDVDLCIIKVDVEGFEETVLNAITTCFPLGLANAKVAVLFECHDAALFEKIRNITNASQCSIFELTIQTVPKIKMPIFSRFSALLFGASRQLNLINVTEVGYSPSSMNYLACNTALIKKLR